MRTQLISLFSIGNVLREVCFHNEQRVYILLALLTCTIVTSALALVLLPHSPETVIKHKNASCSAQALCLCFEHSH
jgi:hypothetical protein